MEQPTTTMVADVTVAFLLTFGPERYRPASDELTTFHIYQMFVGGFEMQVGQYRAGSARQRWKRSCSRGTSGDICPDLLSVNPPTAPVS